MLGCNIDPTKAWKMGSWNCTEALIVVAEPLGMHPKQSHGFWGCQMMTGQYWCHKIKNNIMSKKLDIVILVMGLQFPNKLDTICC